MIYNLFTCLQLLIYKMHKIMKSKIKIVGKIFEHRSAVFATREQKGGRKISRGNDDLLFIDGAVIKDMKSKKRSM